MTNYDAIYDALVRRINEITARQRAGVPIAELLADLDRWDAACRVVHGIQHRRTESLLAVLDSGTPYA